MASSGKKLRVLDLFSGCGGMSLGFSWAASPKARFESAGAIDIWKASCETYEANLNIAPMVDGVSKKSVTDLLDNIGDVDVITGGPPCQGFSTSGKRALNDPRNKLVRAFFDSVEIASPRGFVMENVSGFTTFQDGKILKEVRARAEELGYHVSAGILIASRSGVPQRRRRFFLVGSRDRTVNLPGFQESDHSRNKYLDCDQRDDNGFKIVTFDDATSDLPQIAIPGNGAIDYLARPQNDFQKMMRRGVDGKEIKQLTHHLAPKHSEDFVEMMSYIKQGESARDPEVMKRMPSRLRPKSGFSNSYGRIHADLPAPTITRNFTTPSSANCIHPIENRALSIREGARCQSFPDWFMFCGNSSDIRLQIGNAVPPLLAKAVGEELLKSFNI
jgi:DNA (cytosine-5)-methyltransferase 1